MFSAMRDDESNMFVLLFAGIAYFPVTPRARNRRLRRIARDAGLDRRVTVRTWRAAGRRIFSGNDLAMLAPIPSVPRLDRRRTMFRST